MGARLMLVGAMLTLTMGAMLMVKLGRKAPCLMVSNFSKAY